MRERLLGIHNDENLRPIGRFLLSESFKNDERIDREAAYHYAQDFAMKWEGILRNNDNSAIATVEMDANGDMTVPVNTPQFGKAIYLEFDQKFAGVGTYTWRVRAAREQYDLVLSKNFCLVTKTEYSNQFDVLRRYSIDDIETKKGLQSLVESILSNSQVLGKLIRAQHAKQQDTNEYISLLERSRVAPLDKNEEKRLGFLKKEIVRPRLDSGSVDRRNKKPLLGKHDWLPVPIYDNTTESDES